MKTPIFSGLRGRALLLVILAAVPMLALVLYQGHHAGVAAKRQSLEHAQQLRLIIGSSFDDQIEEARKLLEILARAEPGRCATLAADFKAHEKHYANLGATTPNGDIWCSAVPARAPVNLRDRAWFKAAIETRSFVFGEVVTGRILNRPVLVMGLPAYDRAGKLRAAYFASLDLSWFAEFTARAKLPPGASVYIINNDGTIVSRYPDAEKWIGKARDAGFMQSVRAGMPEATFEHADLDGAPRLYAAAPLTRAAQPTPVYLVISLPLDSAQAALRQAQTRTFAGLAAMVLIVLLVAWVASDRVLLRPVQALVQASKRLSEGDLHSRTGLVREQGEIGELARAFDEMANQLQVRNVEFLRALEELRESEERFRALVETTSDWIWEVDAHGVYTYASPRVHGLLGYTPEEIIGKTSFELMPPDEAERIRRTFGDIVAAKRPFERLENVNLHKDGRAVVLETSGVPVFDRKGALVGYRGIDRDITARKQAEQALRQSNEMLERIFENAHFSVAYLDRDFNFLRVNKAYADACRQPPEFFPGKNHFTLYPGAEVEAIFRRVVETGQPFTIYARPFEFPDQPERGTTWWDWTLSPVRAADGKVIALVFALVDVTERVKAELRAGYLHLHDELTGLPNRVLLLDRLQQAVVEATRRGREAAVLCVDLDRFKYVNDTLGHAAGDALLKEAATRLTQCVRPGDTVARLAGDEFVLVLADMASVDDVGIIVQKIMGCGAKPFVHQQHEHFISVSLGIALFPFDGNDAGGLLKCADLALHQAKERGGNSWQFYSSQMADKTSEKVALSNELRRALERREFVLYYQPQVDIASRRIVGAEALIRWKHPQRGLVPPATFIPLAEETGLITPIGEWVLRQACDQARAWRTAGLPPLRVAVNVSVQQFRHNNLAHTAERALKDCGLPPDTIEIEVTESLLMPGDEGPQVLLQKIADLGVRIAIDDFGTGYSGFSYLKRFPIDSVKVDRSFVRDLATDGDDASIVRAIIAMSHSLEIKTVAEGVETGEQLALLQACGCDQAQGFYFSPPLPADEFARLLREQHACCQGKDYVN